MPEIVKAGYIKFSKQKFPKNIFFIWTNNHYRPLWTYEFKSEDKIKMIFVGSINGLILKGEKTLTKNDFEGLSVATWPSNYAWHEEHGNYIKERIQHSSEIINLNKQVYLKDTNNKLNLPRNSIAVFGYEANRIIMGYSTLADYDIGNKNLLENFYKHIYDVLSNNKVYLIIKRKKKLGNMERRKDRKFFSDIKKKEYVKFIDEDFAVEKIINSTLATVSMPFTSTGFIAKKMNKPSIFYDSTNWININDPSSLGLDVINNKENLDEWVKNLC